MRHASCVMRRIANPLPKRVKLQLGTHASGLTSRFRPRIGRNYLFPPTGRRARYQAFIAQRAEYEIRQIVRKYGLKLAAASVDRRSTWRGHRAINRASRARRPVVGNTIAVDGGVVFASAGLDIAGQYEARMVAAPSPRLLLRKIRRSAALWWYDGGRQCCPTVSEK